jgi:hypothetical protein
MAASDIGTRSVSRAGIYRPRCPERSVLHRLVREHLETFLDLARRGETDVVRVPAHVERTFRRYLECGVFAHGFARARCASCGHDFLVGFSCRTRGLCPSCDTRRMAETAAHLTDHVLPRVPLRQWVLSVPKRVRWFLAHRPETVSPVLRVFLRAVETALRRASPGAPIAARLGAVAFVHRFGASLNSHVHFHCLVTDGVFSAGGEGEASFHEALDLTDEGVALVQAQVRRRVLRWLARHDYLDEEAVAGMLAWCHSGGFSVDASVRLEAWDRQGVERLARYCARPSFAAARLDRLNAEMLAYRLKQPLADGRRCLYLTPLELLARLAALIPPPRQHRTRYHGVLAPHARLRAAVVASAGPGEALAAQLREASARMGLDEEAAPPHPASTRAERYAWALLLARIYEALPLACPRCGEPMRLVAFVTEAMTVRRILAHVGEATEPPALSPSRAPPAEEFPWAADQGGEAEFDQRTTHSEAEC